MKPLIQSKTFWFAILQAVIGLWTAAVTVNPSIAQAGLGMVIAAIIQMFLRYNTTTPIGGIVESR